MSRVPQQKIKLPKINLKYTITIVAALIFAAYIVSVAKFTILDFLTVLLFIGIGAISRMPERFAPISLGIELISLFTIVSSLKYGSLVGALVGVAAFTLAGHFTLDRPQDILIADIGFTAFAFLAPIIFALFHGNLGFVAIALTLSYDAITGIFYFFTGYGLVSVVRFAIIHTTANYFIISYLGAKLLGV